MPVNEDVAAALAALAASGAPPIHAGTPEQARALFRASTAGARSPESVEAVQSVEDVIVPGAEGVLAARIYRPDGVGPAPTVVFFHGGGFVVGDLDTHDNMARTLCRSTRSVVLSVDYRLAPEHPFPAAVDDAWTVVSWAATQLKELGGTDRIGVAGDSAGANLAVVAALYAESTKALAAQFLIYPVIDAECVYPSRVENGSGYLLETAGIEWFADHYTPNPSVRSDPKVSPLHATGLSRLPPTVLVTAEFDPLRDEGESFAEALQKSGVHVDLERCAGMTHGFFDMAATAPSVAVHIERTCALFAELLHAPAVPPVSTSSATQSN